MERRLSPVMWVPPPLFYVVSFLIGFEAQRLTTFKALKLPVPAGLLGLAFIALGVSCTFGSALLFLLRRTTLVPHGRPSRLVLSGAYRFSRNPMYLGLGLLYVGIALRLDGLLPLCLLPLPILLMDRVVIPFEEAELRRTRGAEYEEYCGRVRRWI